MKKLILILIASAGVFTACDEDDGETPSVTTNNFTVTIENIAPVNAFIGSGVFNTPVGNTDPGAATPGKKYEIIFNAGRKQKLSFATMLAATNDLFFGPDGEGIALYDDNGDPISGDVTDQLYLWDAGTEINEEPAVGPNTVTNQGDVDTGPAENGDVLDINDVTSDDFDYPEVSEVLNATVMHISGTEFKLTIENVSLPDALKTSEGDRPAPLSPGVWVLHNGMDPLYTVGMPDRGQGIESIAEDGSPASLGAYAADNTGVTYPASPGGWVLHTNGTKPLFSEEMADYGIGIEGIAEDGSATMLGGSLNSLDGFIDGAVFNIPVGSSSPGPILPGSMYQFNFEAATGDRLSFATMLAATNDVFFAPKGMGVALYDESGMPISGDISSMIYLWDAGTEVNEQPAVGPNTVTNQLSPDTGIDENEPVQLLSDVNDGFSYPAVNTVLKVTISPN